MRHVQGLRAVQLYGIGNISARGSVLAVRSTNERLAKITGEIAWYEEECRKAFALALQYKLEIGKRLALAKEMLPHGKFLSWAQHEFGWTRRHVANHLTLAAHAKYVGSLPSTASMRMALAAIRGMPLELEGTAGRMEVTVRNQRIYLVGEIEEGTLNREQLSEEMTKLCARLGAPITRWKAR
jgi:hypothetical protein